MDVPPEPEGVDLFPEHTSLPPVPVQDPREIFGQLGGIEEVSSESGGA